MSFDLYLFEREGGSIGSAEFAALFAGLPHYRLGEGEAFYENPDTGVYFVFEHSVPDPADIDEELLAEDPRFARPHISFALNYFRPDFFGLEAAAELAALLEGDRFEIHDPQRGSDSTHFDPVAFLDAWRTGNASSLPIMRERGVEMPVLPREANEAAWRWNYHRGELAAALGEDVFVPRLMLFADHAGLLHRAFARTLGVPTVIPPAADSAMLVDDRPKQGLMARLTGQQKQFESLGLVPLDAVTADARPIAGHDLSLLDATTREAVPDLVRAARPPKELLSSDRVLDAEAG